MSNISYNSEAIVIDNGSGLYKVGFAGEDSPRISVPTVIGLSEGHEIYSEEDKADLYLGWGAIERKDKLKIVRPIDRSKIVDWECMEKMWRYTIEQEFKTELEHQKLPLIISAPSKGFKKGRKKMIKILFESFDLPGIAIFSQSLLSMYSTGHVTGLVLEIGEGTMSSVPIFEGNIIPFATNQINLSGKDITNYIQYTLLNKYKINIPNTQYEILQDIKEQMIYINNINKEIPNGLSSYGNEQYELPDGSIIDIPSDIRSNAAEILFNPKLYKELDNNLLSINDIIYETLNRCDNDLKNELISYINITGGTSNIPGFHNRIQSEINKLLINNNSNININRNIQVYADSQRRNSTWMGGSMIASMEMFKNIMITRQEYDEYGEDIIYRKHF